MLPLAILPLGLVASSLITPQEVELPVQLWMERTGELESLALEYVLVSAAGAEVRLHFAFGAPDRCHLFAEKDGQMVFQTWFDQGQLVHRSSGPDGELNSRVDMVGIFAGADAWFAEFQQALPRENPPVPPTPGPTFQLWPSQDDDKTLVELSYNSNTSSLFSWIPGLAGIEHTTTAIDGGFDLQREGLRIVLESEFGMPREFWIGTGEKKRQALRLVSMEANVDLAGEFDIPFVPEAARDMSQQNSQQVQNIAWTMVREKAHHWLWERSVQEGIAPSEADMGRIIERFKQLHTHQKGSSAAQQIEGFNRRIDTQVEEFLAWYDNAPKNIDLSGQLKAFKGEIETGYRDGLEKRLEAELLELKPAGVEDALEEDLQFSLDLERQGYRAFFEQNLIEPVLEHIRERVGAIG